MFKNKVFWKEDFTEGEAQGGIYFRSFDLNKFLERVEEGQDQHGNAGGEVVGIRFGNNLEVIIKK